MRKVDTLISGRASSDRVLGMGSRQTDHSQGGDCCEERCTCITARTMLEDPLIALCHTLQSSSENTNTSCTRRAGVSRCK